jgi:uncharacterized repeat protein (TIGR02543 family)
VWKSRDGSAFGDNKWRWQMRDLDASFGVNEEPKGTVTDPFYRILVDTEDLADANNSILFKKLMKNPDFSRLFVNTMLDLYNVNFHLESNMWDLLDNNVDLYNTLMNGAGTTPGYFKRWGYAHQTDRNGGTDNGWTSEWGDLTGNNNGITKYLLDMRDSMTGTYLPNYFGTNAVTYDGFDTGITSGGLRNVTVKTDTIGADVKINTVTLYSTGFQENPRKELPTNGWTGEYYIGNAVPIKAIAPVGYTFAGWDVTGGTVADPSAAETTLSITDNVTITAKFTAETGATSIQKKGFLNTLKSFFVR